MSCRAEEELLAWMREAPGERDDDRFARLALMLFARQFRSCEPYRRFCEGRTRTPETVRHWTEIPAVPTGAFKELRLACFPETRTRKVFRTSGTATARRGELHLERLDLYEASLVPSFERGVLPDLPVDTAVRMLVLAPSPEEAPDSSLSHMFGVMRDRRGDADSGFFVHEGELQLDALLSALAACEEEAAPVALCGTAFAFVHLLEAMESRGHLLELPAGTRVMETGGFKGRARAMDRDALHAWIAARLGIPSERIVNQYGMTELASQFYDTVLARPEEPRRKRVPPWVRVQIVDPESGAALPPGQVGASASSIWRTRAASWRSRPPTSGWRGAPASRCSGAPRAPRRGAAPSQRTRCSVPRATELRATWSRLRDAGGRLSARPREGVLEPLGMLIDELALPDSPLRKELCERLPGATGFHPATTRAGLELAFGAWSGDALRSLVADEVPGRGAVRATGFGSTAVVLGGALPMPSVLSLVAPLALQSPVLARSGRHDPVTAPCIREALAGIDEELGACLAVADFPRNDEEAWSAFLEAGCVAATGSDAALDEIGLRVAAPTRFVRFGHRCSVAVIGAGANTARAADALALDVALWDQLGCLSPIAAFVLTPDGRIPDAVEAELARAFAEVAGRLPRGAISPGAAADLSQEWEGAELRAAAAGEVRVREGEGWALVLEADAEHRPAPLHRFLRVHPVRDAVKLVASLRPLAPRLAAVGLGAGPDEGPALVEALVALAPSRIAPLGRMQAPPLGWHHDGQGALWPLARFTDIEMP